MAGGCSNVAAFSHAGALLSLGACSAVAPTRIDAMRSILIYGSAKLIRKPRLVPLFARALIASGL